MRPTIETAEAAASRIKDGDTVATAAFGLLGMPEEVVVALENRFLRTGAPRDLTLLFAAGQGDWHGSGLDRLGREGLVRRIIGGHYDTTPRLTALINEEKAAGYNFPQGVLSRLFRAIAARKPGEVTKVGLKTFVDPRLEGGRLNRRASEEIVRLIQIGGEDWLLYPSMPVNVALLRGTTADELGNVTMEEEAAFTEALSVAQAAKISGGQVIVQVKYLAQAGSLHPKKVRIPGILVDSIVVCAEPEKYHRQAARFYDPALAGHIKVPVHSLPRFPLDERKVVGRRAVRELSPGAVVNLGIGIPEMVGVVAAESGLSEQLTFTVEAGATGGVPGVGMAFGSAVNPLAFIEQPAQFDFYDGGGLDIAFLGMAQVSRKGDVNVSRFGNKIAGCGGFINISQNTRRVVFCGRFNAGPFQAQIGDGRLRIVREGNVRKFVERVEQVTFSGDYARDVGQKVTYVTERAVFELESGGLTLIEIAPGVNLEKDILGQMEFRPRIAEDLKTMDPAIFSE